MYWVLKFIAGCCGVTKSNGVASKLSFLEKIHKAKYTAQDFVLCI
jgi:hypothetical protein